MVEYAKKEQQKENHTGIPTPIKKNMEESTGLSFDDVRVHYNSDRPAKLGALAYTQGNQVEIGPGQERYTEETLERQADEIGEGKSIGMSPAGNANTDIVQRYIKVEECVFAQASSVDNKRKVMVKDGEPASIYFDETADPYVPLLVRLGIVKIGNAKDYKDDTKRLIGRFARYGQKQIPNVSNLMHGDHRYAEQPRRSSDDYKKANNLMADQLQIINYLLDQADILKNESGEEAKNVMKSIDALITRYNKTYSLAKEWLEQQIERRNQSTNRFIKWIKSLFKTNKEECNFDEYITISYLGKDTFLDIYALRSIANCASNPQMQNDKALALDIVINDLKYRREQILAEIETSEFLPQLRTACDSSANDRNKLTGAVSKRVDFSNTKYWDPLKWNHHVATPIRLPKEVIGSDDHLFIEDAAGKSSNGNELANAHWAAHIYGSDEKNAIIWQTNGRQDNYELLVCKFNNLSDKLKSQFLTSNEIDEGKEFIMKYQEANNNSCELGIIVKEKKIYYRFKSPMDLYMKHFLMDILITLVDNFVLQAFTLKNKDKLSHIDECMGLLSPSQSTTYAMENLTFGPSIN